MNGLNHRRGLRVSRDGSQRSYRQSHSLVPRVSDPAKGIGVAVSHGHKDLTADCPEWTQVNLNDLEHVADRPLDRRLDRHEMTFRRGAGGTGRRACLRGM